MTQDLLKIIIKCVEKATKTRQVKGADWDVDRDLTFTYIDADLFIEALKDEMPKECPHGTTPDKCHICLEINEQYL